MERGMSCEHEWQYNRTTHSTDSSGYQIEWVRTDYYHCAKCCEQNEVRKSEYDRQCPKWFKESTK